ncbi:MULTISPECIES: hypothetical protein [Hymenobacter]|uniref:Lipoprotein with Yx(FWY)xxD motif n=2 Tax=Hymenobacter TaxID=89966 RepID=A0ABS6X4W2_9BACT|nr:MULTISPECIES: hypothetical protein [Hymenobacter]MBO3271107.1 hypothetical protein [Hymenobacter defluvii]MBW3130063.1 hypothetical protein [Hymenobacter profundi]
MKNVAVFSSVRRLLGVVYLLLLTSLLVGAVSCGKDDNTPPDLDAQATVKLATTPTLGSFLVDKQGNTLYYFTRDVDGANVCTGGCAAVWPIFYEADLKVGNGLNATDFTTKNTAGGQPQTYYKGWPLYYYAPAVNGQNVREQPGATTGEGVGNVWFVVKPDYSLMLATKSVTNKSTGQAATANFLIDAQGRTLYLFGKDARLPNSMTTNCQDGCLSAWPAFYTAATTLPSTLKSSDFSVLNRSTGQQLLYKGRPLYVYSGDNGARGHADGHGLRNGDDTWTVANP